MTNINRKYLMEIIKIRHRIKTLLCIFICCLMLSGITALPIERELNLLNGWLQHLQEPAALVAWIHLVSSAIAETNTRFPFMAYGTDWLAFAHLVIALVFVGPLRDPVKNIWVIQFGLIACAAILPWAFITGEVRHIPLYWRALDCLFGIAGGVILLRVYIDIKKLENLTFAR